jgi:nicotinamide/nicotinate riboside kinase
MHPELDMPDWDTPPGAIEWALFVPFLQKFKSTGMIPLDRRRHDFLTTQKDVEMRDEIERWCRDSFAQLELDMKRKGERVVWGLVDGFLLYWDEVRCIVA